MSVLDTITGWFDWSQDETPVKPSTSAETGVLSTIPIPQAKPAVPSAVQTALPAAGIAGGFIDSLNKGLGALGSLADTGLGIWERVENVKSAKDERDYQIRTDPNAWLQSSSNAMGGVPLWLLIVGGVLGIALLMRGD